MKILFSFVAGIFFSLLLLTVAIAEEQPGNPSLPKQETQTQMIGQERPMVVQPKAGISWQEKVLKQRYITNRAADQRNALKRGALIEEQEQMEDMSISSYNATVRKDGVRVWKQE